ncbi:MAG TPA: class I SAM-dependent methyltransferase [Trichocoleus sp.]|jgi:SAM-dependent methyltransferase
MTQNRSSSIPLGSSAAPQGNVEVIQNQRLTCNNCGHLVHSSNDSAFVTFPCNVRAFRDETFKVWQCPNCITIHCLDVVNLDRYYAKYPFAQAKLTLPLRLCYQNLYRQFKQQGFSPAHSLLDYGCGSGLFVQYLRDRGFTNCYGYDPYASETEFGNLAVLDNQPFDFIVLQDVIEHVEDPHLLLGQLNSLLAPGGHILIGTPNAAKIDLTQPNLSDYYNPIHVPYHLHLYNREVLEALGSSQGWQPIHYFDRPYHDTLWFGLNARAWNEYQRLIDGTLNAVFEPIKPWKALTSNRFWFYALFGYWLSLQTEMAIIFRKTGA